jgi:ABC-2 type transport system permease protein
MRAYVTLVRRELGSYFLSLNGYVVVAVVLFLLGLSIVEVLEAYNGASLNSPLTEVFYSTMFFWMILLLAAPVITMRLFALEKFSGTFETLMTTPVSDAAVVLAKFSAALVFYLFTWLPLLGCFLIVSRYTPLGTPLDWWPVASTYLGILLLGGLYMAMGCLASALTRSQIVAAITALALGLTLFLLSFLRSSVGEGVGWLAATANYISLLTAMEAFVRGIVDTRHVMFFASLTVFFLFLTLKVVESRRWK